MTVPLHAGHAVQAGGFFGNPSVNDVITSLACLCMAGVILFNVIDYIGLLVLAVCSDTTRTGPSNSPGR